MQLSIWSVVRSRKLGTLSNTITFWYERKQATQFRLLTLLRYVLEFEPYIGGRQKQKRYILETLGILNVTELIGIIAWLLIVLAPFFGV